jgi:tRNA nucleotidyltransferase (CCA-adding enzyme)
MEQPCPSWSLLHHSSDIGVRGIGRTCEEAFEQAGIALTAIVTTPKNVFPKKEIVFKGEAPDREILFLDWINSLIYEMSTQKLLFSRFEVKIDGSHLSGKAWGEVIDSQRHQPAVEIKGATLTLLKVTQEPDGHWIAQCIVDV